MSARCGIDLGATCSAISWYDIDNRQVETVHLHHAGGQQTIPSVVYFEEGGNVVVGETARSMAWRHPERVIFGIKCSLGPDFRTEIDGRVYTSAHVVAEILKVLKADAERYLEQPAIDVVIAVPACFRDSHLSVIREAAELAEFNVLEFYEEPCAVALAFAVDCIKGTGTHHILVCDLGGGTFDVTLVRVKRDGLSLGMAGFEVTPRFLSRNKLTEDNRYLGGMAWDHMLAELVVKKGRPEYGIEDPHIGGEWWNALLGECEIAKCRFGQVASTHIPVGLRGHQVKVLRSEFEGAADNLVLQTRSLIEDVLEEAEKNYDVITIRRIKELADQGVPRAKLDTKRMAFLLCGGATRIPGVRDCVTQLIGEQPLRHRTPHLLVTRGAAYRAWLIGRPDRQPSIRLTFTALDVLEMFRDLNLPVTNDVQQISARVNEFRPRYLRMKASPDAQVRNKADQWFKNADRLLNDLPAVLDVTRRDFIQGLKPWRRWVHSYSNGKVPRTYYEWLIESARWRYKCTSQLAKLFADDYLKGERLGVGGPQPDRTHYDLTRIRRALGRLLDDQALADLCMYLEQRLREAYAYRNLSGDTFLDKTRSLIRIAVQNSEPGRVLYYIGLYWIEECNNPFALVEEGLHEELGIYQRKLESQAKQDEAEKVLKLLEKITSESGLDDPDGLAPSWMLALISERLDHVEEEVTRLTERMTELVQELVPSERLNLVASDLVTASYRFAAWAAPRPLLERVSRLRMMLAKLADAGQSAHAVLLAEQALQGTSESYDVAKSAGYLTGSLLSLYDQVEQERLAAEPESADTRNYEDVHEQIKQSLQAIDIYPIPESNRFNPEIHEIVETAPCQTPEEDGEIVRTVRTGFRTEEAILRPAEVVVKRFQPHG